MAVLLRAENLSGARPFSLADAREEAGRILASARAESARLVAAAAAEADRTAAAAAAARVRSEAEGRAAGEEAGRKAGEEASRAAFQERFQDELAQAKAAVEAVAGSLKEVPAGFARSAGTHVVALAVEMAEMLVRRELKADPALVAAAARAALESLAASGKVALKIHPLDRALLESRLPELVRGISDTGRIELVEDASMARGGCVAASASAEADATLDARIAELRRALLGEEDR